MLKNLLAAFFLLCGFSLMAQQMLSSQHVKFEQVAQPWKPSALTGAEPTAVPPNLNAGIFADVTEVEETVGTTIYDLQSNSGIGRRMDVAPDGTIYAVWTRGTSASPAFTDRGTGINIYNPDTGEWGDDPSERIESERSGWPSIGVLADGKPVNVAHTTVQDLMIFNRWDGNDWVESIIPTNVPPGVIWPRLAIGGDDGMSVHVIGLTYPVGNGGAVYDGMDGHLLYYRSKDGGETWDITDFKLPELDSNFYRALSADSYYIDANGSTVAVGLFDNFGDTKVFKSSDNGDTWDVWTVIDFPIDQYEVDQGYTIYDIPEDPNAPDPMAIRSSDQTGTVLVDNDGKVHAWFGEMYVQDTDLGDANTTYYPGTMGMSYWNEDMGDFISELIIPGVIDENENGVLDIADAADIALYFSSLTSHPSAGIDENGIIYLTYSSVSETNLNDMANPNQQHNRHVLVMASMDGGETWGEPWDLTNEELVIEPDLLLFYETQFPAVARQVDDYMHLLYMQDFEPGLAERGDDDPYADNFMNYLAVDVQEILVNGGLISDVEVVNAEELSFELSPNPASGLVRLNYELPEFAPTSLSIYNAIGAEMKSYNLGNQPAGNHFATIDVGNLTPGIYLVRLQTGDKVVVKKLQVN